MMDRSAAVGEVRAMAGGTWDRFLAGILDTWLADGDQGRVSVRNIDAAISYATTGRADQCIFADRCDGHVVVERNGDIYPCDFFVSPETRLGNIMERSWRELLGKPSAQSFAARKCRRHLSRISQMDFYDRIARLCLANNATIPQKSAAYLATDGGLW